MCYSLEERWFSVNGRVQLTYSSGFISPGKLGTHLPRQALLSPQPMVGEDPVGDKKAMQTELIEREEMGREEKMKRRGTGPTQVLPAPS